MAAPSTVKFSKFIECKIRKWFQINNMKRDGLMGYEDFSHMADVFIQQFHPNIAMEVELRHWLVNTWSIFITEGKEIAAAGNPGGITEINCPDLLEIETILSNNKRMTEDQYVKGFCQLVEVNKDLFVKTFGKMITLFFNLFDTDKDGYMTVEDMITGWKCFGVEQEDATRAIFKALDKDCTGKVSRDVYLSEWIEFMVGEDEDAVIARYLCKGQL